METVYRRMTVLIVLVVTQIHKGSQMTSQLTMLTEGQVYVLNPGESLALDCNFQADQFNLFDYPVLWRKTQCEEETQVNIMGNVNEPYMSSNRFEVAFASTPPRYRLELTIVDIRHEDSGNYTCEVRGPQSVVLGQVIHAVYVKSPVQTVIITDESISVHWSSNDTRKPLISVATLRLVEGRPHTLRCTAFGGYPPPSLDLYVSSRDITSDFLFTHSASLAGSRGLRQITYRTDRWTHNYIPLAVDDELKLKCIGTVPGLSFYTTKTEISVDYAPKIRCDSTEAYVGERNVALRCEVASKPRTASLFWIIDGNGTQLFETEMVDEQWTFSSDSTDGKIEVQLFIREVKRSHFHQYTMVAENSVGLKSENVDLSEKIRPRPKSSQEVASAIQLKSRGDGSRDTRRSFPSRSGASFEFLTGARSNCAICGLLFFVISRNYVNLSEYSCL